MLNPFKEVQWNPDVPERRKFARSLILGFPCVAIMFFLMGRWHHGAWNLKPGLTVGGIGVAAGLVLYALPAIAKPFYLVWYAVACTIGLVMGNLLLAGVFYGLVTPLGWLKKAVGRPQIRKTLDRQSTTYWQDAETPKDPQRYYSQF